MSLSGKINKLSILGCGWLGAGVATKLSESGIAVNVSTTTQEKISLLKLKGWVPFLIDLKDESLQIQDEFFNSEVLLISIPPGTRKSGSDHHFFQIQNFLFKYKELLPSKIIYTSSTSVYPDLNTTVDEGLNITEETAGNKVLLKTENLILDHISDAVILRLGGLTGYDRLLIKYFSGKQNLIGGQSPVNMLHRDDAVNVILQVIKQGVSGIFNVCSPLHPTRKEFYTFLAHKFSVPAPEYALPDEEPWKEISTFKVQNELGYKFIFENPLDFTYSES